MYSKATYIVTFDALGVHFGWKGHPTEYLKQVRLGWTCNAIVHGALVPAWWGVGVSHHVYTLYCGFSSLLGKQHCSESFGGMFKYKEKTSFIIIIFFANDEIWTKLGESRPRVLVLNTLAVVSEFQVRTVLFFISCYCILMQTFMNYILFILPIRYGLTIFYRHLLGKCGMLFK